MTTPNHLVGGLVFTGTTAALCGSNIFDSPAAIAVTIAAALMPDVDSPTSFPGMILKPLSKYINRHYGHRTITHSLAALFGSTAIFYAFGFHPLFWFLGYFSHLLFDMLTLQGVPLLFPFLKNPCVVPSDPNLRFRTGDMKAESISFASFILLGVTLQPLMNQGFWTRYNSQWGTQKHLASEFQKATDLLEVTYSYDVGSQNFVGKGFCVEATENKTVLLCDEKWVKIDPSVVKVKSINFEHTGKKWKVEDLNFANVSADSVNRILENKPIIRCEIQSNVAAKVQELGQGGQIEFKNFKVDYPSRLWFYIHDSTYREESFIILPSVTAKLKRSQIQSIRDEFDLKRRKFESLQDELKTVSSDTTTDYLKRESNMKRAAELRKIQPPELDQIQIRQLEFEAQISEQQDNLNYQIRYQEHQQKQREKAAQITKGMLTGFCKVLIIN